MNWEIAQKGKTYSEYRIVFEIPGPYHENHIIRIFSELAGKKIIKRKPIYFRKKNQWISMPYIGISSIKDAD